MCFFLIKKHNGVAARSSAKGGGAPAYKKTRWKLYLFSVLFKKAVRPCCIVSYRLHQEKVQTHSKLVVPSVEKIEIPLKTSFQFCKTLLKTSFETCVHHAKTSFEIQHVDVVFPKLVCNFCCVM